MRLNEGVYSRAFCHRCTSTAAPNGASLNETNRGHNAMSHYVDMIIGQKFIFMNDILYVNKIKAAKFDNSDNN